MGVGRNGEVENEGIEPWVLLLKENSRRESIKMSLFFAFLKES